MIKLAIVIPAFNEERSIGKVVAQAKSFGDVIVVNDNSRDATETVALASGAQVINHPKNLGYEGSLNSGFKMASDLKYTHIITLDADGQHPVEVLQSFINSFADGFELVVGVRDHYQRFSELLFSRYTKIFFNLSDPLCGLKGYSMRLFNEVGYFDSGDSVGTELTIRFLKEGLKFKEIHFVSPHREHGKPRFHSIFRANIRILKALIKAVRLKP